jgi:sec-independent protein translocase protein TatB
MNILGIGPLELVFIVIIMVLFLGPDQMVATARKTGAFLRKVVKSPLWHTIMDTSRELRDLPTRIVREAGIEEELKEIKSSTDSLRDLKNISVTYVPPSRDSGKKNEKSESEEVVSDSSNISNDKPSELAVENDTVDIQSEIIPPDIKNSLSETNTIENPES